MGGGHYMGRMKAETSVLRNIERPGRPERETLETGTCLGDMYVG